MVYFITDSEFIKIGYTKKAAEDRLRGLQTGNPKPLTLLGTIDGGRDMESHLHAQFAQERCEGEWFKPSPMLIHYLATYLDSSIDLNRIQSCSNHTSPEMYSSRLENAPKSTPVAPADNSRNAQQLAKTLIAEPLSYKLIPDNCGASSYIQSVLGTGSDSPLQLIAAPLIASLSAVVARKVRILHVDGITSIGVNLWAMSAARHPIWENYCTKIGTQWIDTLDRKRRVNDYWRVTSLGSQLHNQLAKTEPLAPYSCLLKDRYASDPLQKLAEVIDMQGIRDCNAAGKIPEDLTESYGGISVWLENDTQRLARYLHKTQMCGDDVLRNVQLFVLASSESYRPSHQPHSSHKGIRVLFCRLNDATTQDLQTQDQGFVTLTQPAARWAKLFTKEISARAVKLHSADNAGFAEHVAKYNLLLYKLAYMLHLLNGGMGKPIDGKAMSLSVDWVNYLQSHAQRLYTLQP